jgi:dihydroflavonol-4-reductase
LSAAPVSDGRVLVTGGTGFVGGALVERLVADGREVLALARSDEAAASLAALGATPARGDVLDGPSVAEAARGCDAVFHVAGVNAMCLRDARPMFATNVEGSERVLRAAAEAGVGRVVHTSSAATLGERTGAIGTEESPHRGTYLSAYERSKHLAEQRVRALAPSLGVELVTVNPSSVQGPGRTTGSARLLLELVNGRLRALVDTWISLVDVADCAEAHVLAEAKGRDGERYVVSGASVTTRDAVALVQRLWGRPERVRWMPRSLATAAGMSGELAARVLRRDVPVCREAVRTLLHGHRYDGTKAERELGLRYTPLPRTIERTLAWYEEHDLVPARRERHEPRTRS